jgi:hypothetical protein
MPLAKTAAVVLVLLVAVGHVGAMPSIDAIPELADLLQRLLGAMESALGFAEERIAEANLDGVIGIRLIEGQCVCHMMVVAIQIVPHRFI